MLLIDAFFYLWITPVNITLAILGTLVGLALRRLRPELSKTIIKGAWLLALSLLVTGFLLTECWGRLVFGRLYQHFDYLPGIDCSPFWLNPQYGTTYNHGMTKQGLLSRLYQPVPLRCRGVALGHHPPGLYRG